MENITHRLQSRVREKEGKQDWHVFLKQEIRYSNGGRRERRSMRESCVDSFHVTGQDHNWTEVVTGGVCIVA